MDIAFRRQSIRHNRALRADRQASRGNIGWPQFGIYTNARRYAIEEILNRNATRGGNVHIVRRRMRKGWTLNESLTANL